MSISKPIRKILCGAVVLPTVLLSCPPLLAEQDGFAKGTKSSTDIEHSKQDPSVRYETYILGAGDRLKIELLDLPGLSGIYTVGPDGTIYLPLLQALQVEGLTIEELRETLAKQFLTYVRQPEVFITPIGYRAVRVYVGGEVAKPGYYTVSGSETVENLIYGDQKQQLLENNSRRDVATTLSIYSLRAPTLFDALQAARGVTPFSQLDTVRITRKRPLSQGGGKIQTKVNFLRLLSDGDEDVNIRLYDGDTIFVKKSNNALRDQLLTATRTNLSPNFIQVFVSGRVRAPGEKKLRQGASLNQAIASAGGPKLLRGRVEFLRFNQEGSMDRRLFGFNPKAKTGDYQNPVLMPGDIVRVHDSIVSASVGVFNELTAPAVGIYSTLSLFKIFQ